MNRRVAEEFLPLRLFHHFGGRLPTQDEALFVWTLHILSRGPQTYEGVVEAFQNPTIVPVAIEVELQEVRLAVSRGLEEGSISDEGGGLYALTRDAQENLVRLTEQALLAEEAARNELRLRALELFPGMGEHLIDTLWSGLKEYTSKVVLDYVYRTSVLDTNFRAVHLVREVFPTGHALSEPASVLFPRFLTETMTGKELFARSLSAAIYTFRTSISDAGAKEIKATLKYRTLVLDTNVLLTIIGLRGEPVFEESTRRLLRMAQEQGFSLEYTGETKKEYVEALERVFNRLSGSGFDYEPEYIWQRRRGSIFRAYLLQRRDRTPAEFFEYYSDLGHRISTLEGLSISEAYIPDTTRATILESDTYQEAMNALMAVDYSRQQREHDAYNVAYVAKDRDDVGSFSRTKSWFLTHHGVIGVVNRKLPFEFPIVLTLDAWVLHFRRFMRRVSDYDEFLLEMIASSVFYGFRLTDSEIEVAKNYLVDGASREASEVVAGVFQRTATLSLREELDLANRQPNEALLEQLLEYDYRKTEMLHKYSFEVGARTLQEQNETIRSQREQLEVGSKQTENLTSELAKLREAEGERSRALEKYLETRRARDTLRKSVQAHKENIGKIDGTLRSCRRWRLFSRVLVTLVASGAAVAVISVFSGVATLFGMAGLTPFGVGAVAWWLSNSLFSKRLRDLEQRRAGEQYELSNREAEVHRLSERLEAEAEAAGLRAFGE